MIEIVKRYYDNGNLYWEAEYMNDVLHGYFNTYYDNGNLCGVNFFLNDVQEGEELLIFRSLVNNKI